MCVYMIVQCKLLAFSFQRTRTHPPPCNNVNHASTPSMQTSTNRFIEQSKKHSSNQPITESINRTCSASTQSTNAPIRRPDVLFACAALCQLHASGRPVQHFNKLRRQVRQEAGAVPAIFRPDVRELVWKRHSVALAVGSTRQLQPGSPASPQTRHVKCLFATKAWSQPDDNVQLRDIDVCLTLHPGRFGEMPG